MAKVDVFKQDGSKSGDIELKDEIFGIVPNDKVLFDAIIAQRASLRQGTHAVKNRSAVRGGGRKPWRQKGTGRARQGSIRSPQWRGGGIVFGPTPRSYAYKLPKKMMQLALKSSLSQKVKDENFIIVDEINFESPKTKLFIEVLDKLKIDGKILLIVKRDDEDIMLAARNLSNITIIHQNGLNVLDITNNDRVLITKNALSQVEEDLS